MANTPFWNREARATRGTSLVNETEELTAMSGEVRNWSESLAFAPTRTVKAGSEEGIVHALQDARSSGLTVRPVGSKHSATPIFATDGVLLDTSTFSGLFDVNHEDMLVRLGPGTGLAHAGGMLHREGLAFTNLGDVDYQTIAGAIGTGTHGTGQTLGNLSTMLVGGVLITGTGDRVPFGIDAGEEENSDLVRAARVSFGTLGIMTSLTLRVVSESELVVRKWITHVDWVLQHFEELAAENQHFDFYWYPRNDCAQVRTMNPPEHGAKTVPPGRLKSSTRGPAHEVIPNDRHLKFNEMEYMLPREAGLAAFKRARQRIKERHRQRVAWRVLVRTIAADDAMLSPSFDRPTVSIALLHNHTLPYAEYFGDMEPLFQSFSGRPHWGKKHTMRTEQLSHLYPEWGAFQATRRRLDPEGTLLTSYLADLLEGGSSE